MSGRLTDREKRHTEACEHPAYLPDEPRGYLAWHEWAEAKVKTHFQKRCPHCGLYAIWVARKSRGEARP